VSTGGVLTKSKWKSVNSWALASKWRKLLTEKSMVAPWSPKHLKMFASYQYFKGDIGDCVTLDGRFSTSSLCPGHRKNVEENLVNFPVYGDFGLVFVAPLVFVPCAFVINKIFPHNKWLGLKLHIGWITNS